MSVGLLLLWVNPTHRCCATTVVGYAVGYVIVV
jgi:hypothetical protein